MTTPRRDGNDTAFSNWMRHHPELSSSHFVTTDIDYIIQRYRPEVDSVGTREINYMMQVEEKTYGREVPKSQHETLWFQHQCLLAGKRRGKTKLLEVGGKKQRPTWHFGCSIVTFSATCPTDGTILWSRFDDCGRLQNRVISEGQLVGLLRFDLCPDRLTKVSARRHHKTTAIEFVEQAELGFEVVRSVLQSS